MPELMKHKVIVTLKVNNLKKMTQSTGRDVAFMSGVFF